MLIPKKITGWVLWPFVFVRSKKQLKDPVFLNHECIHLRQQRELLVLPFLLWYGIEFLVRWVHYKDRYLAYRNISFEREAYEKENDLDYLPVRQGHSFTRYL